MIIFVDMDGVLADFDGEAERLGLHEPMQGCMIDGFFSRLPVLPDAKSAMETLRAHHDVFVASTPIWSRPQSLVEKTQWLYRYFPWVITEKRLILTSNKGKLRGDVLIDDHPDWNGANEFEGVVEHFKIEEPNITKNSWPLLLEKYTSGIVL